MEENRMTGRVTIPTDLDVVPETLEILKKWGADAIRDCDGTDFPQELKSADAKIYSTYYTTRKDNAWAKANPDEVQQCYIMTGFYTAPGDTVTIPLMKGISPELMQVNTNDDITRWWEVMDRSTGQPVPPEQWSYADGSVTVQAVPFHEYTVSFLAYLIWDPVHMYNATTNGWTNFEHQITFDVRQPKTHKYSTAVSWPQGVIIHGCVSSPTCAQSSRSTTPMVSPAHTSGIPNFRLKSKAWNNSSLHV